MRAYNIKRKKAFSLTELLIVIIIIGVLAGIAMLSMSSMDDKYYKDTGKGTDTIHLPVELGS